LEHDKIKTNSTQEHLGSWMDVSFQHVQKLNLALHCNCSINITYISWRVKQSPSCAAFWTWQSMWALKASNGCGNISYILSSRRGKPVKTTKNLISVKQRLNTTKVNTTDIHW